MEPFCFFSFWTTLQYFKSQELVAILLDANIDLISEAEGIFTTRYSINADTSLEILN